MSKCEGFKIAFSSIDSTCDDCRLAPECKKETNYKLLNAKIKGETMENLTKEQLGGLLEAATLKKEVAMINKKYQFGCSLVKGMTIEEAKDLIMETAFPPVAEEDDGFELEDDEGTDEFDDFEDSDDASAKNAEAEIKEDPEPLPEADDDLEGLEDSDLDDNPDADVTATAGTPDPDATTTAGTPDPDQSPDIPEGMDEEEYDSLIGRISSMEKRLDDIYQILAAGKGTNTKSKAAEAGAAAADEGEKLKAAMPYSDEDLDKMNAKVIKKLCKAIGINSFQKKVVDLVPQIKAYQDENCK